MVEPASSADLQRVTRILSTVASGEPQAAAELLPLVYGDLRKLAAARMARLQPGQTLQATALVHESYMRLVGSTDPGWQGRAHFFGAAARAMRDVLADHLRRKGRLKRGAHLRRIGEDTVAEIAGEGPVDDVLAVEEALEQLERSSPRSAEVVTLHYFGGLSSAEIAEVMKLSARTVEREWRFAKAWLNARLAAREPGP